MLNLRPDLFSNGFFFVRSQTKKKTIKDYIDSALATALQIHQEGADEGDVLIFLPGQEEIEDLATLLKRHLKEEEETSIRESYTSDVVQPLHGIGTDLDDANDDGKASPATIVNGVMVCVLYAALPPEVQMKAFAPKPKGCHRKIILATNIAETSGTFFFSLFLLFSSLRPSSFCYILSFFNFSYIGWYTLCYRLW